jgi:hypothetical protein
MSPEVTMWMLSILGASLFFCVGFFTARAVQPRPIEEPELGEVPTQPGAFDAIVLDVQKRSGARSVAIADDLGLPIAGVGLEQEGLAALAGLLGELEHRARLLLPVGAFRRVTLELDHGAGVTVCPLSRSEARIALATLTERN